MLLSIPHGIICLQFSEHGLGYTGRYSMLYYVIYIVTGAVYQTISLVCVGHAFSYSNACVLKCILSRKDTVS